MLDGTRIEMADHCNLSACCHLLICAPPTGAVRESLRPAPARDAATTPRSVISPVTSRAGVTSKP